MVSEVAVFVTNVSLSFTSKIFDLYVLVVYEVYGLHCDTVQYGWWSNPEDRSINPHILFEA
jgi:hypothetical protein